MKIGFDAKRYFNNSTGLGNYARWLIRELTLHYPDNIYLYHKHTINHKSKGIEIQSPSSPMYYAIWRIWLIIFRLKKQKINIYHGLTNEIPFGIHKTEIKTVVTIHDLIQKRFPENYAWYDLIIYNLKVWYAQKYAHKIVTVSEQTKADLMHFYHTDKSKILVIPIGINTKNKSTKSVTSENYILCVSSFSKRKNLDRLIDAFRLLDNNETRLILVGNKGDVAHKIIKKVSQDNRIELIFNASKEKLENLYRAALFCVYPSIYEGFGMPIMEAFSYGKTVATSNISSMPEVGKNAAHYFNPNDTKDMSRVISELLIPENRELKEKNIPSVMKSLESKNVIKEYIKLYDHLMTSS